MAAEAQVSIRENARRTGEELDKIAQVVEEKRQKVKSLFDKVNEAAAQELEKQDVTPDDYENVAAAKDDAETIASNAMEILSNTWDIAISIFS
jgi:hypothetical protein